MTNPTRDEVLAMAGTLHGLANYHRGVRNFADAKVLDQADAMLRAYAALLDNQFSVGELVFFRVEEYVIECWGDRPGTFDLKVRENSHDHWVNVPPNALTKFLTASHKGSDNE